MLYDKHRAGLTKPSCQWFYWSYKVDMCEGHIHGPHAVATFHLPTHDPHEVHTESVDRSV